MTCCGLTARIPRQCKDGRMGGVGAVRILTVGRVQVRPKNIAGSGTPMLWWTFTSREWSAVLPVHAFVIEHSLGTLLWDTGAAPASAEPGYFPGGLVGAIYRRQVRSLVADDETLDAQLALAGVPKTSIALAAISHLHYDHAGNVASLGAVPILVSEAEHALLSEKSPQMHGVLTEHVAPAGADFTPVAFTATDDPALAAFGASHDIHGDGSLVLLPTPGHSAGSMSLLVRRGEGRAPLLLVGDVTYDPALMDAGVVPDVGDRAVQLETAGRIRALREALPGLVVLAAHDPNAATLLAAAGE